MILKKIKGLNTATMDNFIYLHFADLTENEFKLYQVDIIFSIKKR